MNANFFAVCTLHVFKLCEHTIMHLDDDSLLQNCYSTNLFIAYSLGQDNTVQFKRIHPTLRIHAIFFYLTLLYFRSVVQEYCQTTPL